MPIRSEAGFMARVPHATAALTSQESRRAGAPDTTLVTDLILDDQTHHLIRVRSSPPQIPRKQPSILMLDGPVSIRFPE
jgi:hypothetical protein